jgi:hypothetical protein
MARPTKHNMSHSRLYRIWKNIKQRTGNPNNTEYRNYGGKGIVVCDEWLVFDVFKEWALSNGYMDTLTIERNNNDIGYCPENCKWIPSSAQKINRRGYGSSEFRGVSFDKSRAKWVASLMVDNKYVRIGRFATEYEAAEQYDLYCIINNLNKPLNVMQR